MAALSIEQSLARHHEELRRRGLISEACPATPAGIHAELLEPQRRRRWVRTYRAEQPERAFDEALGESAAEARLALSSHTRSSLRAMPSWWSNAQLAFAELNGAAGVMALQAIGEEARARVEAISLRDRSKEASTSFDLLAKTGGLGSLRALELNGRAGGEPLRAILRSSESLEQLTVLGAASPVDALLASTTGPGLRRLRLSSEHRDAELAELLGRHRIEALGLFDCTLGAASLEAVARLPLDVLALDACVVRKPSFKKLVKALTKASTLRTIALTGCEGVDAATLAELAGIASLRHVRVKGRKLAGSFVSALAALPLEELSLVDVALGEAELSAIGGCTSLRRLHLEHTGARAEHLVPLGQLGELVVLDLGASQHVAALPTFTALPNLYRLRIGTSSSGADGAFVRSQVPSALRELDLDGAHLAAADVEAISTWPLQALTAISPATYGRATAWVLGDEGAAQVAKLEQLEWLHVGKQGVGKAGLESIARLPALRWLYLSGNPIHDGASLLRSCPSLRVVSAESCGLDPSAVGAFADLPKLEELYAWDNPLGAAPIEDWARLERLSELNVVGVGLSPEKLAELRAALPRVDVVG